MSTKLSIGIVGLPNVGKSTLFQALTKKEVTIANYPFATIDPNVGVVEVPDERLDKLAELFHSQKKIPAVVEFVDIAGLVKDAHKGEGLGNKFLANIREVAVIVHAVRAFSGSDVHHVAGTVDPVRDIEIIETELILKDLETVEKRLASLEKEARAGKKEAVAVREALEGLKAFFDQGRPAHDFAAQNPDMAAALEDLQLVSSKPVIFLVNANGPEEVSEELKAAIERRGSSWTAMNMKEELEAAGLSQEEAREFGIAKKLPDLIGKAYEILGLITFFTAGEKESRAWTIVKGAKAPEAGSAIHSDFQEKFIKTQVISWDKLVQAGGYAAAGAQGLVRTEGKDYVVQDGDVMEFKHG